MTLVVLKLASLVAAAVLVGDSEILGNLAKFKLSLMKLFLVPVKRDWTG